MIPFLQHPVLYSLAIWLEVAFAMVVYFHTAHFEKSKDAKEFDLSWKITTGLMWPICFVAFVVVAIAIFCQCMYYHLVTALRKRKEKAKNEETPPL